MTTNRNSNFPIILILFGFLVQTGHGWTDYTPWFTPFRQIEIHPQTRVSSLEDSSVWLKKIELLKKIEIEIDKISKMYPTNYGFKTNFGKHNGNLVVGPYEKWMKAHLEFKLNEIWNKKKLLLKPCLKGTGIKFRNFKLRT